MTKIPHACKNTQIPSMTKTRPKTPIIIIIIIIITIIIIIISTIYIIIGKVHLLNVYCLSVKHVCVSTSCPRFKPSEQPFFSFFKFLSN